MTELKENSQSKHSGNSKNIILGTIVGIITIYLSFKDISLADIWLVLKKADQPTIILGLIVVLLNVSLLSIRWWVILVEKWEPKLFTTLLNSIFFSQMLNIVFPARLGELGRIFYAGEKLKIAKSRILGTLVVEKVIDIVAFGGAILVLLLGMTLPENLSRSGMVFIWVSLFALAGVFILTFYGLKILNIFELRLSFIPAGWRQRIFNILRSGLSGMDSMKNWKRQIAVWLLSISIILFSTLTNYLLLLSLQINVPLITPLAVLVVTQIGSTPPSTPGKLGVFHYLVILALSFFGVEKELALAYSLILYFVAIMPKIIWGAAVLIQSPIKLSSLQLPRPTEPA